MSRDLKEVKDLINSISPSFCAAKWLNTSIWLGNGRTASCHHPLAHYIPKMELQDNPSALHNTEFKKERRKEMLEGKRPDECSYCWRVEDIGDDNVFSDRVYKSNFYSTEDILSLKDIDYSKNVDPKTVEICFDNLCNLGCSYCNSEFSSTWANDIATKGSYVNMKTSGGHTYENAGEHAMPFGNKNEGNIYVENFFKWFDESLKYNLDELRVSGGEPSRSPAFWKLLDICDGLDFDFAVNSNLIMEEDRLNKLIASASKFRAMDVYTSAECFGKNQEFVRYNFKWDMWYKNLIKLHESGVFRRINIMMTISSLSVWTVDEFLDEVIKIREKYNSIDIAFMSVNILRFPSFQSINVIGQTEKKILARKIKESVERNQHMMKEWEINQFERLIQYLLNVDKSYEDSDNMEDKINDLKNFVNQYSTRRKMDIYEYMPKMFLRWWKKIN
jgi:organic radical activating enzyme